MRCLAAGMVIALTTVAAAAPTANKKLMAELASGTRTLGDFVEPSTGVVLLERYRGAGETPRTIVEKQLCGAELTKTIARWQKRLATELPAYLKAGLVACSNRPGPRCSYGRMGEWDPAIHLVFRPDAARGLVLLAITSDDEVLVGDDEIAREHATQTRLIAKLSAKACPAT